MKKTFLISALLVLSLIALNKPAYSQDADLYLDNIEVYVSDYGRIAIYSLPDETRQLYQASLLVGTGENSVFDLENDIDIEDPTEILTTPSFGDFEIYGAYNNYYSGNPPDVLERQNIYCWQSMSSIIVKYTVINRETSAIDAIIGHELVPNIDRLANGGDTCTYSISDHILSVTKNKAVGFKPLSDNFKSVGDFVYFSGYQEDSIYYNWLTYNKFDTLFIVDPNDPDVDDPVLIPAYNSVTIAPNDSVVYYLAIAIGENEAAMLTSLQQAQDKYNQLVSVESDLNNIPLNFTLDQNYPNPFNPSTKISFGLPERSNVVLKVFNALGQQVAELVNGSLEAGTHAYNFEASNLTSGIYIYSLQTDAGVIAKKMTLMK